MMSALMSDIVEEKVTPRVANATVNAGGKLLRVVELQIKYGEAQSQEGKELLKLSSGRS